MAGPSPKEREDLLSRFIAVADRENAPGTSGPRQEDAPSAADRFLRDIILNFILAGRDTTSVTLTWFFWALTQNRDVEEKILEEVERIAAAKGPGTSSKSRACYIGSKSWAEGPLIRELSMSYANSSRRSQLEDGSGYARNFLRFFSGAFPARTCAPLPLLPAANGAHIHLTTDPPNPAAGPQTQPPASPSIPKLESYSQAWCIRPWMLPILPVQDWGRQNMII
jgi:hypothetical protein